VDACDGGTSLQAAVYTSPLMHEGIDCTDEDVKHMGRDNGIIAGHRVQIPPVVTHLLSPEVLSPLSVSWFTTNTAAWASGAGC
jgi:hypothetical protein